MRISFLAAWAISGAIFATASAGRADQFRCVGDLGNKIVKGDLVVPDGASCVVHDATVTGNVLVGRNAALRLSDAVRIRGSVRIDRCQYASFDPLTPSGQISVGGNVEIERCSETSGKLFTAGTVRISGNFDCHDNAAPCFAVSLRIYGDALINRNSGGMSYVEGNTISGKLECVGNTGVTDYGDPNTVTEEKIGQCAGLAR